MREKLNDWLEHTLSASNNGNYRHQRLRENLDRRPEVLEDLKRYILRSHDDARSFYEGKKPCNSFLDPLEEESEVQENETPSTDYLALLPMTTLKGYFGEVFAGIIAENFSPFGTDSWKVPAYLFRFHDTAFQYLEILRQTGRAKTTIFGRTGDDCLAFALKDEEIDKILYCEAKCTKGHSPDDIMKAYKKFNESVIVDIYKVIQILKSYTSQEAKKWYEALDRFLMHEESEPSLREMRRYNLLSYVYGQLPIEKLSWLPEEEPHSAYNASHPFEAVEIHLHNVEDLIYTIYNKEREPLTSTRA